MSTSHPNVWSSWLKTRATTDPSFPMAPASSPLAFMVSDLTGDEELVTFHWRKQPIEKQHGPKFRYLVNDEKEVTVHYWEAKAPNSEKVMVEIAGLNSVGKSLEVLRMSTLPKKKGGGASSVGPSVVVTNEKGDTVVLWGESGQEVVERQVIWGAGSTDLLEEGIDWADAGNTTGRLTLPQPSSASQRVFLAAKNADGSSHGMERVKCKLMARDVPDVSLVLANASSTTLELKVGLGLCSDKEDENLLLQKATLTICRSGAICEESSLHDSNSISLTNLPSSTCFCIGLDVQTMLGNASLDTSPSSTCSYCTGITVNDIL